MLAYSNIDVPSIQEWLAVSKLLISVFHKYLSQSLKLYHQILKLMIIWIMKWLLRIKYWMRRWRQRKLRGRRASRGSEVTPSAAEWGQSRTPANFRSGCLMFWRKIAKQCIRIIITTMLMIHLLWLKVTLKKSLKVNEVIRYLKLIDYKLVNKIKPQMIQKNKILWLKVAGPMKMLIWIDRGYYPKKEKSRIKINPA